MVSLLEHERWPADHTLRACFLWFLSTAPAPLLQWSEGGRVCTPKLIGNCAFQVALTVALSGAANGRLWLHAAPQGGQQLFDWYLNLPMEVIDPAIFPTLPGYDSKARVRQNDGRYFWLEADAGQGLRDRFLSLMRQS